jgi:phage tail tape-measure protein
MDNDSKDGITAQVATNLDPITGAPGAHLVGVGLGAAVGGIAAGAAAGTVAAGPLGAAVGAAVGAIAGGLGGKAVAEHFDPTLAGAPPKDDLRTTSLPRLE